MVSMSVLWWFKKVNVICLSDPDKEQSTDMKSVVAVAYDTQSVVL